MKAVAAANPAAFTNGRWYLEITNFSSTVTAGTNAADLREFKLNFTSGMTVGTQGNIAGNFGYNGAEYSVVGGSISNNYPTASNASPTGIGPGLVLAEDNTLGPDSPFQGIIYAAFVAHAPITVPYVNPVDNTDIFEEYSKNGGRTWSAPVLVNDDSSDTDGYSEANASATGRRSGRGPRAVPA